MKLKSTSNYFEQSKANLSLGKEDMMWLLNNRGFTEDQQDYFVLAYEYFCLFPDKYDGATQSQDLIDVLSRQESFDGLELSAMLHDWIYIFLKARYSVKTMKVADKIMEFIMHRFSKSGFEISWRLFRLAIIRRPFAIFNQIKVWFNKKPKVLEIKKIYLIFINN